MANELFALLTEAKTVYLHDVVSGGKQYHRYVDDFVNGHRYIDCDHAACRNCHEMNIHIVKGLLTEYARFVQICFATPNFTFDECMKLKRMYDTSESLPPPVRPTLTDRQISPFLLAVILPRNRWKVLWLVPILIICSVFLYALKTWRLSSPVRKTFPSV